MMSLQRESVSKEFFREIELEGKKDFVLYFGFLSLNHFYKRELEGKVKRLASGKCSILIQVLSEKTIKQRVPIVLMRKR